ncbi:MAG: 4'-phosphopantetheinyl transferase superfamily protein [Thermoflavifilum sp.]|nr:4'-phosphopantetheinyl transferase superfamily protein [Thermoflavifilum sp.]
MPFIERIELGADSQLGIWHITEDENFFLPHISLIRQISHPHKRLQHMAGRYMLTQLCPSFPISQITVLPSRKPIVPGQEYYFSIAHSRNYVAAIVSRREAVGVDIEHKNPVIARIAPKFLSPDELCWIEERKYLLQLTLCWAAKEAIYKWYGLGKIDFRRDIVLNSFVVERSGTIEANFLPTSVSLLIDYRVYRSFCVAWTMHEKQMVYG